MKNNQDFIQLKMNGLGMDVYIHIDVYDKIKSVLEHNWNRTLPKRRLSLMFTTCDKWRRLIVDGIVALSNNSQLKINFESIFYEYELSDNVGILYYSMNYNMNKPTIYICDIELTKNWKINHLYTMIEHRILRFSEFQSLPNSETVVATNEHVMPYEQFQRKRINETIDALVGVTFTDEDGTVQNTADGLDSFLKKPWEERFHYVQIDDDKYVYDSPGSKVVLKGCEEMGEVRDTQWFVHENGTIASFRRCSDRGYFFAETDIQLHPYPLCKEPAYEQVWTQLQIVPEWVLKHFSILEFIGGVDIDDVA